MRTKSHCGTMSLITLPSDREYTNIFKSCNLHNIPDSNVSMGSNVWTDGTNLYLGSSLVYNREKSTWEEKNWEGLSSFSPYFIWTDGTNIYYSVTDLLEEGVNEQYVLNKQTGIWEEKTWGGFNLINAQYIWTDGNNIYYSENEYNSSDPASNYHYVLNKNTGVWEEKVWTHNSNPQWFPKGDLIWSDGEDIYLTGDAGMNDCILKNGVWEYHRFVGWSTNFVGWNVWTDGKNIYYTDSYHYTNLVFNKAENTWEGKEWVGRSVQNANNIWTDGINIYYGPNSVLLPTTAKIYAFDGSKWEKIGNVVSNNGT